MVLVYECGIHKSIHRSKSNGAKANGSIDARLGKVSLKNSPFVSDSVVIIVGLTGKIRVKLYFR